MTCDPSIELLPWLLNGTLETAERHEVLRHLATCDRCREALAETRTAWSTFDQHIPSQDLVALAWGESPSGIDPALAETHLTSCPLCAAELELVRMSRRLEEEDNVALFPAVKPKATTAAVPRTWRAAAVAASLAAVVAASGWVYTAQQMSDPSRLAQTPESAPAPSVPPASTGEPSSLRQEVARLQGQIQQMMGIQQENEKKVADAQTQIAQFEKEREILAQPHAAEIVELDAVVRAGEAGRGTIVRSGVYSTLLLPARGAAGKGSAEILDESGKVVRRVGELTQKLEYYSLVLPPRALSPGRYTVRLSGQDEARSFQVVP